MYLISDVDGCFVNASGRFLKADKQRQSQAGIEIGELIEKGQVAEIFFCTGRDGGYIQGVANDSQIPVRFSVIEHGGALWDHRTEKLTFHPDAEKIRSSLSLLKEEIAEILPVYDGYFYPKQVMITVYPPDGELEKDIKRMARELPVEVTNSGVAIDIVFSVVNKKEGIIFLRQKMGFELGGVIAVGDSFGDEKWISYVSEWGARIGCPSNSSKEWKTWIEKTEGYVARKPYATGVLEVIRHFL